MSNNLSGHLDPIAYLTNGGEYFCPSKWEKSSKLDQQQIRVIDKIFEK